MKTSPRCHAHAASASKTEGAQFVAAGQCYTARQALMNLAPFAIEAAYVDGARARCPVNELTRAVLAQRGAA